MLQAALMRCSSMFCAAGGLSVGKAGHLAAGSREAVPAFPLIKLSFEALELYFAFLCIFEEHCVCLTV